MNALKTGLKSIFGSWSGGQRVQARYIACLCLWRRTIKRTSLGGGGFLEGVAWSGVCLWSGSGYGSSLCMIANLIAPIKSHSMHIKSPSISSAVLELCAVRDKKAIIPKQIRQASVAILCMRSELFW